PPPGSRLPLCPGAEIARLVAATTVYRRPAPVQAEWSRRAAPQSISTGGACMRSTIFSWLDREFVGISGEGKPGLGAAEATRELLGRFGQQLAAHGLSLDDAVRNRLFARDRASWQAGSPARRAPVSEGARA